MPLPLGGRAPSDDHRDVIEWRRIANETNHDPAANYLGRVSRYHLTQSFQSGGKPFASSFDEAVRVENQQGTRREPNGCGGAWHAGVDAQERLGLQLHELGWSAGNGKQRGRVSRGADLPFRR